MTDKEKHKFYHSKEWQRMSAYIMRRDHYECQVCRQNHKLTRASQVHHIIHLEDNQSLALDEDNLEAVCIQCHNILHGRDGKNLPHRKKKPATKEMW